MADHTASSDILKRYALKVSVSSVKERTKAVASVTDYVNNGAIPEGAVKGIFRYLSQAIGLYRDGPSRRAALNLVSSISKVHFEASVKALLAALENTAKTQKSLVNPSRSSAGDALQALSWTCVVVSQALAAANGLPQPLLQQLVGLQAVLVYGTVAARNEVITQAGYRKLCRVWREVPGSVEKYLELVSQLEQSTLSLPLTGFVLKYLAAGKQMELIQKYKGAFLDVYIKQVLASRTAPPRAILESSAELLRHCSHAEFKDQILPAAQKAMLRNPEVIQETVSELIKSIKLDLSQYAVDIAKLFSGAISSKEESNRAVAVRAVRNLAHQCSDPGAVEKVATLLFKILGGSEGKLTFADQKISVLQAIGNLVHNTVSGYSSLQALSSSICEMFLPTLQQEVHEGTLVHSLSMLALWCAKFYNEVPEKLLLWFQKGFGLKTSTSAVRNAYIRCMNTAFHGDTLPQATHILPLLLQTLDKAEKQPGQPQLLSEAVSASCLLVRVSLVDIHTESKLGPFWNLILDNKKQYLVNEKFLSSATDETLQSLVFLIERLILDFPTRMTDDVARPYYRALIFCLCRRSWLVRHAAATTTKKILAVLGGARIALSLVHEFQSVLHTQKLSELQKSVSRDEDSSKPDGGDGSASKVVTPRIIASTLQTVCSVARVEVTEAEKIAMATLIPAHHPYIVHVKKDLWVTILRGLNLDPGNFVGSHAQECLDLIKTGDLLSEAEANAVSTLALASSGVVVPQLVSYVQELLSSPALVHITQEEYGIFLTPDGQLYDKTILESAMKASAGDQNVRKENKLYSYAEQMAELELRQEMERKKGKKPQETPKLSKKQEEQLAAQKQKESDIRNRLRALNRNVLCSCSIVDSLLPVMNDEISTHVKDVYESLVPLLQSPLAAQSVSTLFVRMARAAFTDRSLADLVSHATLRLLQPACPLERAWTEEKLLSQTVRAVSKLYIASVRQPPENSLDLDDGELEVSSVFPAPTFCCMFYLLRCVLNQGGAAVKGDMIVCSQVLQLIQEHAKMRRTKEDPSSVDVYDPDLLPRQQLLEVCLTAVGTFPHEIQQLANNTLLELARAANGDPGATVATDGEVQVLLKALQSPSVAVRDVALQCLAEISSVLPGMDENPQLGLSIAKHVWIACNDPEIPIQQLAT
ncbi:unnamed protein product, partial [Candidula unifasciata]